MSLNLATAAPLTASDASAVPECPEPPGAAGAAPSPVRPTSRDGRLLGKRALETRERLLDALLKEIEAVSGWRQLALLEVARSAGTSPAAVYQLWDNAEDALFDLTRRQLEARVRLSARHLNVLESLAVWGWPGAKRLLAEVEAAPESKLGTSEVSNV